MNGIQIFRKKLQSGATCLGAGITLTDPLVTDAIAGSVDFLWIDAEHSGMSMQTIGLHLLAARANNVPALVRVGGAVTHLIKAALDLGADGIIVPHVRSAEEVRGAVADCRYPPQGHRGFGPRVPSRYGRQSGRMLVDRMNAEIFVAVQIETREALDAIEAIAATPGLDSLALGPSDLSHSLGLAGELEHPENVAAIERVIAAAQAAGRFVGTGMGPDIEYARVMASRGCQWIQVGGDVDYIVQGIERVGRTLHDLTQRTTGEKDST